MSSKHQRFIKWLLPEVGWIEVNSDDVMREAHRLATTGGIFRDNNGVWLTGFTAKVSVCSVMHAELWGAVKVL